MLKRLRLVLALLRFHEALKSVGWIAWDAETYRELANQPEVLKRLDCDVGAMKHLPRPNTFDATA